MSHGDVYGLSKDRVLGRQGNVHTQGPRRSQCGQSPGSVGGGDLFISSFTEETKA